MSPRELRIFFRLLGERAANLRRRHGWTQEAMTEFGFSLRHYQGLEAGRPVNLTSTIRLAEAFEVDLSVLLRGLIAEAKMLAADRTGESEKHFKPRRRGRPRER